MGVHLGVIGLHSLHFPPFARMCLGGLMGPCTPHLITNPMLRLWQYIYYYIHLGIHFVSNSEGKLCHEHRPCIVIRYAQENLMHYLTTHVRCILLLFILWLCCNNPKAIELVNFLFCHSSIVWLLVGVPRKQRQNEYIATIDFLTSQHLIEGAMSIKQHTKWIQRKWNSITNNLHNVLYNNEYNFIDDDR